MNAFGIRQTPESIKLAKELVSMASNVDFRDLRNEMVESLLMRKVHGERGNRPEGENVDLLLGVLELVLTTVEVMADDIARTAELRALLDAIAKHPDYEKHIAWLAEEPPTAKPLRRLSIVDEQLREVDGL